MSTIRLSEILNIARQESARLYHHYIGVEHLFIALTKLKNGLSSGVLQHCGLEPRFVRYSIREVIGISDDRRFWSGFKNTPRADHVLKLAERLAGIHDTTERDLFLAIIDEGDNIPTRVLQEMGADLSELRLVASNWSARRPVEIPSVPIQSNVPLDLEEQEVLQRLFRSQERIFVERELGGSYSGARIFVVQPFRVNNQTEAKVVVKIDSQPAIQYEKRHYDSYVKYSLPPTTARLLDNPALPDGCSLGGLKYTLVQPSGGTDPIDLKNYALDLSGIELSNIIRTGIYEMYAPTWWSQRQRYRFGVWREYEHVLPAAIEVHVLADSSRKSASRVLEPLGAWSRRGNFVKGELIELRGFTVQKVRTHSGSMQIAAGDGAEAVNRSSKVELIGIGSTVSEFRPGDTIPSIVGRVTRTRDGILWQQVALLDPPFDFRQDTIQAPEPIVQLPNPLAYIEDFLERHISGYHSIIHGDLHMGNILVGPGGDSWLIDFGLTREGHTLFDWAVLEVSILSSVIAPRMPGGWDGVWGTVRLLSTLNESPTQMLRQDNPVADAIESLRALREIVHENLANPDIWREYYVALMLVALRGLSWEDSTNVDVRRLLFLTAALAVKANKMTATGDLLGSQETAGELTTDVGGRRLDDISTYSIEPISDDPTDY